VSCRLGSLNEEPLRPVRIAVAGAVATIAKVEVRSQHQGRNIKTQNLWITFEFNIVFACVP
jgi:hypothetical protein